jgi:hypothetical protein
MSEVADGPETKVTGRSILPQRRRDPSHRLRDCPDDLARLDDAEVIVRHERERTPALDLHGCDPSLGEKRVVHAGEEEGYAHRDADHDRAHRSRQSGITLPP